MVQQRIEIGGHVTQRRVVTGFSIFLSEVEHDPFEAVLGSFIEHKVLEFIQSHLAI